MQIQVDDSPEGMALAMKNFLNMSEESIIAAFPKYKDKVFTLREYVYGEDEPKKNISDPWGYGMQVYETCAKEIVECVDKLLEKI